MNLTKLSETCSNVTTGQPLKPWQQQGLELVALLQGRDRDVVLAMDLTESVDFNAEGRIRLSQIVQDSLEKGDTVYVVPFASEVDFQDKAIAFQGRKEDIQKILDAIPLPPDLKLRNTDILKGELYIYQYLAGLNQCRLEAGRKIKPQSVVWITDAPLGTNSGADWIETPADSPFRDENSSESQARRDWLNILPLKERSREIVTGNGEVYKLSVVDIPPTVQEFCTPAPGGKETCLVTPYLIGQLWLPAILAAILAAILVAILGLGFKELWGRRKKWTVVVKYPETEPGEEEEFLLAVNRRIDIGGYDSIDRIECAGEEVRGYLERKGNRLFLVTLPKDPAIDDNGEEVTKQEGPAIYYNGKEVTKREPISGDTISINCPDPSKSNRDFEIDIKIEK